MSSCLTHSLCPPRHSPPAPSCFKNCFVLQTLYFRLSLHRSAPRAPRFPLPPSCHYAFDLRPSLYFSDNVLPPVGSSALPLGLFSAPRCTGTKPSPDRKCLITSMCESAFLRPLLSFPAYCASLLVSPLAAALLRLSVLCIASPVPHVSARPIHPIPFSDDHRPSLFYFHFSLSAPSLLCPLVICIRLSFTPLSHWYRSQLA
ncbi:hypothetical protein C8R45DRAFT_1112362 [Mycena sanguinolenta]|nr:hypothetical protein C8R45DRAFT_1112362 [Mycena sanguinolenta]